jgi:hypothetical protein
VQRELLDYQRRQAGSGGVKTGRHAKAERRLRTETVASDDLRLNERR